MTIKTKLVLSDLEPYGRIWKLQQGWAAALAQDEVKVGPLLWVGQHLPVITLGLRGSAADLLLPQETLAARGVEVVSVERGGLATLHAPGQLVAYPILTLDFGRLGIKELVRLLEKAMILTLADLGIQAGRSPVNPGVWVGADKIGFVGLAVKRRVTFHGLALNLNLDLGLFDLIVPCGLTRTRVTSAKEVLGRAVDLDLARKALAGHLAGLLGLEAEETSLDRAEAILAATRDQDSRIL